MGNLGNTKRGQEREIVIFYNDWRFRISVLVQSYSITAPSEIFLGCSTSHFVANHRSQEFHFDFDTNEFFLI